MRTIFISDSQTLLLLLRLGSQMSTVKCRQENVDKKMSKIKCRPKKNVDNVKRRQLKMSASYNTKKRSWWWKNKIGAWGRGWGWGWGWLYFTINSKKVVFNYVQANTYKENAQTEKKDDSICYAIFLYHDRVFDSFFQWDKFLAGMFEVFTISRKGVRMWVRVRVWVGVFHYKFEKSCI